MGSAYRDAVAREFLDEAGKILAEFNAGRMRAEEALDQLTWEYQDKVDDLPEVAEDDE